MKALLIHPRLELLFEALMPEEVGEKWIQVPALGPLYVRETARSRGFEVDYLDADALDMGPDQVAAAVAEGGYAVAGVTVNSYNLSSGLAVAGAMKKATPDLFVVAGGVHPTIYPLETANLPEFDAAVAGEGEFVFCEILKALQNGAMPDGIPGVAVAGREFVAKAAPIKDLDSLPIPRSDGLPLDRYWSALARSRPVMPMVTSRGCPFQCTFCDRPRLDRGLRPRSADNVIEEVLIRQSEGVNEFSIYDDTFTANKKRTFEICEKFAGLQSKIRFDCRTRVDTVNEDVFKALAEAGCDRVYFGIESGDENILKSIKKNTSLDQVSEAVKSAKKAGLRTLGYYMLGLPGEDEKAALKTIELAVKLKMDFALIEVFIPMPDTEAYEQGLRSGAIGSDYWQKQAKNPDPHFAPPPWPGPLEQNVAELIRVAYRRVYLSPAYLLRSLISIRTWEEFRQKVKGFLRFINLKLS